MRICRLARQYPRASQPGALLAAYMLSERLPHPCLYVAKALDGPPIVPFSEHVTPLFLSYPEPAFPPGYAIGRARLLSVALGKMVGSLVLACRALPHILRFRPDLFHVHTPLPLLPALLYKMLRKKPIVLTFHGTDYERFRRSRFTRWVVGRFVDHVICMAPDQPAEVRALLPAVSSTYVQNGVDLSVFSPDDRVPKRKVVVAVGRLTWQKAYDDLIEAMARVIAVEPGYRLVLVGEGPLRETLRAKAEAAGISDRVEITGMLPQVGVVEVLRQSEIFVMSSISEGSPKSLIEAMACGLPVVVTDVGACASVAGGAGLVVAPGRPDELASAILSLLADPARRRACGAGARREAQRYGWQRHVEEVDAIYERLLPRPRVAHVTTIDGSLRYLLLGQLRSLEADGYEVVGISTPGPDVPAIEAAGIPHVPVAISRNISPLRDLRSLWRLYRLFRRERYTIVHTHTPKPGLLAQIAARLAGVPVVVNTLHGTYSHDGMRAGERRFHLWLDRIAARCSDLVLSQNSEDLEAAVREGVCRAERIEHLGNGIDLAQFDPDRFSPAEVRARRAALGIPEGVKVVGFVGRLAGRRKGFLDFLAAGERIVARRGEVRFLIVGESDRGKPDAVDPARAGGYGIADVCVFLGNRPNHELPLLYRLLDVLVLPSLFEGIPRAIMEAAAMGIPVVASDVKGNREAVVRERTGHLVPRGDVEALSAAILGLLDDPRRARALGREARRLAAERFDERVVFAKVKASYRRLLAEKGILAPGQGDAPTRRLAR